jgi:hypothetical protein
MNTDQSVLREVIAFQEDKILTRGRLRDIAAKVKAATESGQSVVILDAIHSDVVDVDWRLMSGEAEAPASPASDECVEKRKPGRPRLGVVAREVTLLPRHWEWLGTQPGGASVALRKLVEEAIRKNQDIDRLRQMQDSVCRFMTTLGGNRAGFEEGLRAFYARNVERFKQETQDWPKDIQTHLHALADAAFKLAAEIETRKTKS